MTVGSAVGAVAHRVGPALDAVVAHSGTTHAGTPHWVLGTLALLGVVAAVGGWALLRDEETGTRFGVGLVSVGVLAAIAGAIGLVEIQIAPQTTPDWTRWFPVVNAVAAILVALGSLVVVRLQWPERPRYVGLSFLLAAWIAYPTIMPNEGLSHPFGYLLAFAVPVAIGYVLYRDGGDGLSRAPGVESGQLPAAFAGRLSKVVAAVAFTLFGVFFAFSAGTISVNPDVTPEMAGDGFVTSHSVASPLVYWPAIEFYVPAIPLSGYVSVGTVLLAGLLGGLVALNAGLVARQWESGGVADSPRAMVGTIAASGATACCCCAPALYGAVGVLFGAAATPVYWAFMDPTSPVGGLFFAASVLLLAGSALRASHDPACAVPRESDSGAVSEQAA